MLLDEFFEVCISLEIRSIAVLDEDLLIAELDSVDEILDELVGREISVAFDELSPQDDTIADIIQISGK